jgi:hypothetical protein
VGFWYYKGCEECQKFGNIQLVSADMMHPIIRPWPFRGWELDFIGEIHPPSSKGHCFILVATDYITKWTKAVPLKNMTHKEVIGFIMEHITHRFGIPQSLITDRGTSFYLVKLESLWNLTRLDCSILLHFMVKPMVKLNQVMRP